MNFNIYFYYAMPVLSINVKVFELYTQLLKLNNFYFGLCTRVCILLPEQ